MRLSLFILLLNLLPVWGVLGQTIRIAALRVEFVEDSNPLTTGDGTFAVDSITTEPFAVDPAPHNRTYFKDQIIAVDNYYNNVSGGKVRISGEVFPKTMDGAYQLPNEMSFYNSNISSAETDKGISNLFKDAVMAANNDPDLIFADYDLVVIFHAGVGKDIDLGFDETPQDIPSLYVTNEFVSQSFDTVFTGISVDNGAGVVDKAIILPETENQQGLQIGITGIFAANIGSYLGLYDLFSNREQRTGVGKFALMDAGLFNVNGLIPAPPCAFSRALLGWDIPMKISVPNDDIHIAKFKSAAADSLPVIIEIPLNEDESFLLENRGTSLDNLDSVLFSVADERDEIPEYMEILQTHFDDRIQISDSSGVLLAVDDYDLGMPGAGIIIWHIDQNVIRNTRNRLINDNPLQRAIDVEEADGTEDIGQSYTILQAGYLSDLGWLFDYWYFNNDAELYTNEFSETSTPNTKTNNGSDSHIIISNFSNYFLDYMTFDFDRDYYETGFPVVSSDQALKTILISGVIKKDGISVNAAFSLNDQGQIYVATNNGEGLFSKEKNLLQQISADPGQDISIALMDTNLVKDGINDILIAMSANSLFGIDLGSSTPDSMAQILFEQNVGITAAINSPVTISNRHIYFVDGDLIQSYGYDGEPTSTAQNINTTFLGDLIINDTLNIPFNPFDSYNYLARISNDKLIGSLYSVNGTDFSLYDLTTDESINLFSSDSLVDQFSLSDIDGNGSVDILFNTAKELYIYNQNGSPVVNFPVIPRLDNNEILIGTPMIISVSDAAGPLIFITSNNGKILAYNRKGKIAKDYPITAGGIFTHPAIPIQLDDDEAIELISVSNSGTISAWEIPGTGIDSYIIWGNTNLNARNNVFFNRTFTPQNVGNAIAPKNRFFNYPNPNESDFTTIRYYLNQSAKVTMRIFDIAGYKVDEFSGPGIANTDNEVIWNVKNISSGVYVCQLQAETDSGTERKMIKILVVH